MWKQILRSYLWRHVDIRTTESSGRITFFNTFLTQTEIGKLYVALTIQQHIIQLEISIYYMVFM